jgi:hypothetical protein
MKTTEQTGILTMRNVSLLRGGLMPSAIDYRQQIAEELRLVPDEKLADLAKIVHVFTERVHVNKPTIMMYSR